VAESLVGNELEWILKNVIFAKFWELSQHMPGWTEKNKEKHHSG
jgi:hypothetical protein